MNMTFTRRQVLLALAASAAVLMAAPGSVQAADGYPSGPVTLVVPFAPGGNTDVVSRRIAQSLSELWGETVIVENKPGAGTVIGVNQVARAKPNGQVLGTITGSFAVNPYLMPDIPYDTENDLQPVAMFGLSDHVLAVHPSVKADDLSSLVELAREKPGELAYASFGNGSSPHLSTELLKLNYDLDIIHVPYRGQAPGVQDLLGGQVQMMLINLPQALPLIKDGQLKAIGIAAKERSKFAPDIPTLGEQGFEVISNSWSGLIAPAGTPEELVQKINTDVNNILDQPEIIENFELSFMDTWPMSVEEFSDYLNQEMAQAKEIIEKADIHID